MNTKSNIRSTARRAFTLIELVAVMVVLAILAGVAIPKYFDYADRAKEAADEAAIGGISTALSDAHLQHRVNGAPSDQWIASVNSIAALMDTGQLPSGITIVGVQLEDQRGNRYNLTAETQTDSARLIEVVVVGGGS